MTTLTKEKTYNVIPGTPGRATIPGIKGTPGTPAYCVETSVTARICSPNPVCSSLNIASTSTSLTGGGYDASPCSPSVICRDIAGISSKCYPAVSGTPGRNGTPGIPGTPSQLITYLNEGWNSHSRTIEEIVLGSYLLYDVAEGVQGVMISIGPYGKDNHNINLFTQSILVEKGGIMVFEDGVHIDTIKYTYSASSKIRLYRQPDNRVVCVVTDGIETVVHVFDNYASLYSSIPLYAYCHMYIADDTLTSAEFETGEVYFGEA